MKKNVATARPEHPPERADRLTDAETIMLARPYFYGCAGLLCLAAAVLTLAASAQPPVFLLKWGSPGNAPGQFSDPSDIALDASGNLFVADAGNGRIQVFTNGGTFRREWPADCWSGLAIDAGGNVYAASRAYVRKFTSTGNLLAQWEAAGCDRTLCGPSGLAVDGRGNVYVADEIDNCVRKFTSEGVLVTRWGTRGSGNGQFGSFSPWGLAADRNGDVYVCDYGNYRIQKFTGDGVYLDQWGQPGSGDGQFQVASSVAIDREDNVYVIDRSATNPRIEKFTSDGTFVYKWGAFGRGDGQFDSPAALALNTADRTFVSDSGNHRIQVFGYPATPAVRSTWGRIKAIYR